MDKEAARQGTGPVGDPGAGGLGQAGGVGGARSRVLGLPSGLSPADRQGSGRAARGQPSTCDGSSGCRWRTTATEGLKLAESPLSLGGGTREVHRTAPRGDRRPCSRQAGWRRRCFFKVAALGSWTLSPLASGGSELRPALLGPALPLGAARSHTCLPHCPKQASPLLPAEGAISQNLVTQASPS